MADGGSSKDCSCLCGFVGRYLRQHAVALFPGGRLDEPLSSSSAEEAAGASLALSKEAEKDLLISLTVVCREIKRWTTEVECEYEQDSVGHSIIRDDCPCHLEPPFECQNCSANIISLSVVFLVGNNQYVRHMTGKVLVAISNFLLQYLNRWEEFIRLLWISLQVAISSCTTLCTSDESVALHVVQFPHNKDGALTSMEGSDDDAQFVALLRKRLKTSNWLMPAALMQVLHIIQKSLKKEDGGLAESYLHFAVFSLLKVPWSLLTKVCAAQSNGSCIIQSAVGGDLHKLESNSVFLGAVLQLLCSLVEQNILEVGGDSPLNESSVYFKFTNLISELLVCCFYNSHRYNSCMYQYLRHKVLVLMIRLSFWSHWQCSSLVSWLQFLHKYFKDILYQPISICHAGHDISVEGSPFLSSIIDGGKVENICTMHLQRQTIFLFFKCCFALICFSNQGCHECTCGSVTSFTCELQKHGESGYFDGLAEISGWLRRHVPLDNYADDLNYIKSCRRFSLLFLQLYMDEDDLLFEMLLQLLDAPFSTMQGGNDNHENLFELGEDMKFHILNIFSPVHLFHLFLSLVHYDHLVLLDYLISKDTGVHFVQYLLRCIRLVCKSWNAFVEFSLCCTEIDQRCFKRRKLCMRGQESSETLCLTLSASDDINGLRVLETGDDTMHIGSKQESSAMPKQMFQDAKECLLSLKQSIEDLHRKNLFPYSPAPLLRSFTRFQELCEAEQERIDGR